MPDPFDKSQPLEARARAYLHANCWHCHVVNGGGNADMELSFLKKPAETKIYDVKPRHITFGLNDPRLIAPGDPDRSVILRRLAIRGKHQMPPVASFERDDAGLKLLTDWVRSLKRDKKAIRRRKPTLRKP
jgi:mono/diheme cytochrome c family protein